MSSQTEWGVRNPPSNQPGIVWGKRSLATQCANPQCSQELLYLGEGSLALLDMESHANDQPRPDDGAFATRTLPSSFFWLCGECTKTYVFKRWTTSGLVVVLRDRTDDGNPATPAPTDDSDLGWIRAGKRLGIASLKPNSRTKKLCQPGRSGAPPLESTRARPTRSNSQSEPI